MPQSGFDSSAKQGMRAVGPAFQPGMEGDADEIAVFGIFHRCDDPAVRAIAAFLRGNRGISHWYFAHLPGGFSSSLKRKGGFPSRRVPGTIRHKAHGCQHPEKRRPCLSPKRGVRLPFETSMNAIAHICCFCLAANPILPSAAPSLAEKDADGATLGSCCHISVYITNGIFVNEQSPGTGEDVCRREERSLRLRSPPQQLPSPHQPKINAVTSLSPSPAPRMGAGASRRASRGSTP